MIPLWLGVLPFGIAFAVLARTADFNAFETQAFSALVFAGSAQVAAVTLAASGTSSLSILLTTCLLNLRHVLYGLSLSSMLGRRTRLPRSLLAFLLTDEVYGVTTKAFLDGRGSDAFLLGAGISLYAAFNLATFSGSLLGAFVPDLDWIGLDFIFPLTFLDLLLPLLQSWRHVLVAVISGLSALVLSQFFPGGVALLLASVAAAATGVALDYGRRER